MPIDFFYFEDFRWSFFGKMIGQKLWAASSKDTTQQLLGLHDAKITNTYEIMCMRGGVATGFYD
ncbi:hypothetical protein BFS16_08385 [Hoylesella timonensis]|uniref:Uncharacterized protein n=1 Tax=Hoylesella timonensis TaxID=386414 RepID=A0A2K0XI13_9BACT|nr:hypothetical protein BFS16_08385 [Hoylesella timonensis]